jgi:translation initiation factor IF-1
MDKVVGEPDGDADRAEDNRSGNHGNPHNQFDIKEVALRERGRRVVHLSGSGRRCAARSTHQPLGVPIPPPRRRGGGKRRRREPLQAQAPKEDTLSLVGRVIETFPSSTFKVELENGHTILASLAGRLRRFRIRITPGDDVDVELSPYDLTRGRITYRRQGRNAT